METWVEDVSSVFIITLFNMYRFSTVWCDSSDNGTGNLKAQPVLRPWNTAYCLWKQRKMSFEVEPNHNWLNDLMSPTTPATKTPQTFTTEEFRTLFGDNLSKLLNLERKRGCSFYPTLYLILYVCSIGCP